jgi:hypothetical protein
LSDINVSSGEVGVSANHRSPQQPREPGVLDRKTGWYCSRALVDRVSENHRTPIHKHAGSESHYNHRHTGRGGVISGAMLRAARMKTRLWICRSSVEGSAQIVVGVWMGGAGTRGCRDAGVHKKSGVCPGSCCKIRRTAEDIRFETSPAASPIFFNGLSAPHRHKTNRISKLDSPPPTFWWTPRTGWGAKKGGTMALVPQKIGLKRGTSGFFQCAKEAESAADGVAQE